MSGEPNYKIMELQNENEHLKDDLIKQQKDYIHKLESEISYLRELVIGKDNERDAGSHMIAPPNFKPRQHIRTTSEVATLLEQRSLNAALATKSVEDINEENKAS